MTETYMLCYIQITGCEDAKEEKKPLEHKRYYFMCVGLFCYYRNSILHGGKRSGSRG